MRATLNSAAFKPIVYKVAYRDETPEVAGYAFETPGWPEFRCCVRRGSRFDARSDSVFNEWIVDHYDTGLALSLPMLKRKEDAPAAVAKRLEEVGREKVRAALGRYGL